LLKSRKNLFTSFGSESFDNRYVLQQFLRKAVPFLQILWAVVGNPGFSLFVFPDKNLQRQIDSNAWRSQHQWRPRLRTPENQQLCRPHLHSHFFCLATVVDERKKRNSLCL